MVVARISDPGRSLRSQIVEGTPSWGSVPGLSGVQQQLKMIKCFLLGEKLAMSTLFFFSLANSSQFRHYSCKHTQSCSRPLKHLICN